jgi:hypothetical protein
MSQALTESGYNDHKGRWSKEIVNKAKEIHSRYDPGKITVEEAYKRSLQAQDMNASSVEKIWAKFSFGITLNAEESYASVQSNITDPTVLKLLQGIRDRIDVDDVLQFEEQPHITVRYGFTEDIVGNVFCATGEGGGIDPSCGRNRGESQTSSPEFKAWFKDSKVVDESGNPLVVYHGTTNKKLTKFRPGSHFGTEDQAKVAGESSYQAAYGNKPVITIPVYLSIQNPKRTDDVGEGWEDGGDSEWKRRIKQAKKEGYDGIVYRNEIEGTGDSYIAFRPNQVKSAHKNRGTFDSDDPVITNITLGYTQAQQVIKDIGVVQARLGKLSVFELPDADVLKIDVEGNDLHRAHKKLELLPHVDTHPNYQPHLTIAYLKPGTAGKYLFMTTGLDGYELEFDTLVFSSLGREQESVTVNSFCPTGKGGGVDPTCGKGGHSIISSPSIKKINLPGLSDAQANEVLDVLHGILGPHKLGEVTISSAPGGPAGGILGPDQENGWAGPNSVGMNPDRVAESLKFTKEELLDKRRRHAETRASMLERIDAQLAESPSKKEKARLKQVRQEWENSSGRFSVYEDSHGLDRVKGTFAHELGHVLGNRATVDVQAAVRKHGLPDKELWNLSDYAKSHPAEIIPEVTAALALGRTELVGPQLRKVYAEVMASIPVSNANPVENTFCPTGPGGGVDATCKLKDTKSDEQLYDKWIIDSAQINKDAREGHITRDVKKMDDAIAKAGPVASNTELYRGISLDKEDPSHHHILKNLREGYSFQDKGFASVSSNRQVAADFAVGGDDGNTPVVMRINVEGRVNGMPIPSGLEEVVLERGLSFKVQKITTENDIKVVNVVAYRSSSTPSTKPHSGLSGKEVRVTWLHDVNLASGKAKYRDDKGEVHEVTRVESGRGKKKKATWVVNSDLTPADTLALFSSGGMQMGISVNEAFSFQTSPEKAESFRRWLAKTVEEQMFGSLEEQIRDAWWRGYIEEGYKQGAGRAFDDTKKPYAKGYAQDESTRDFYRGSKEEFLRSAFGHQVSVDKVKLLAGRVYTDIKGVTDTASTKLQRYLTDGIIQGKSPREVGREMNDVLDAYRNQATTVARTETIRAHAEGQLDAMDKLGVEDVGVAVEWSTSGMGVTALGNPSPCELCAPLAGIVMKVSEARGLIPRHPNCQCSLVPANVGEDTKGQLRSPSAIKKAFLKSIKAEIPRGSKRTLAQQKAKSRWKGVDKSVSKKRPRSMVG